MRDILSTHCYNSEEYRLARARPILTKWENEIIFGRFIRAANSHQTTSHSCEEFTETFIIHSRTNPITSTQINVSEQFQNIRLGVCCVYKWK